jgi:hypothetical protein
MFFWFLVMREPKAVRTLMNNSAKDRSDASYTYDHP